MQQVGQKSILFLLLIFLAFGIPAQAIGPTGTVEAGGTIEVGGSPFTLSGTITGDGLSDIFAELVPVDGINGPVIYIYLAPPNPSQANWTEPFNPPEVYSTVTYHMELKTCWDGGEGPYDCNYADFDLTILPVQTGPPYCPVGSNGCPVGSGGKPINFSTGDVSITATDYSVPGLGGGLAVTRTWNSQWLQGAPPSPSGMFGLGWTSNFEEKLQVITSSNVQYWRGDGNFWFFQYFSGSGTYELIAPSTAHATLVYDSGQYTIMFQDGTNKVFNNGGYLLSQSDRNGNTTTLSYDTSQRISGITGAGGQSVSFTYESPTSNLVYQIYDSVRTIATYYYSGNLLTGVVYPDSSALNYTYDGSDNISSVSDANSSILESHTYDSQNRGTLSAAADNVAKVTVDYSYAPTTVTVSNSLSPSQTTTFTILSVGGENRVTDAVGPGCAECGVQSTVQFTYDSSGNPLTMTDANGHMTCFSYDDYSNIIQQQQVVPSGTCSSEGNLITSYTYNSFE